MPTYEYRCNQCGRQVALFYKTYKDYDAAVPTCPDCGSGDLTRVITRVSVQTGTRSYQGMSSGEMLSVLEGGDAGEVRELFRQSGTDERSVVSQVERIKRLKEDSGGTGQGGSSAAKPDEG